MMDLFDGYIMQILHGTWMTIQVAVGALLIGLLFGLLGALAESSRFRLLRYIATSIIAVLRGLPELLILFFVYFGGTILLSALMGRYVNVSSFISGVIGLAFIFGAYASQTFRGAFLAIPYGQIEAAKALGMACWHIFMRIQMPQAWRHALPGLGNLWLVLLKDTALVSLIGLADLMNVSQVAASSTHKPFTFFLLAALIYLVLTSVSQQLLNRFARNANRYVKVP